MKTLFLFLALSLSLFSNSENKHFEKNQVIEISAEEVLQCDFTYSAPQSLCNASANGNCRGVNFDATGYGIDIYWDFGPNVCSVSGANTSTPTAYFDVSSIPGNQNQTVTVTFETEDYYGNVCIVTKNVTFLVC